jgi:hypothetical protein
MKFLFLDESGEFGFEAGSSRFLLIAILEVDNPKTLKNIMRKEKTKLHDLGWPRDIEIKGTTLFGCHRDTRIPTEISNNRLAHIDRIITRIIGSMCRVHYSIVRKSALQPNLRNAPYGIAYNYFAGNLICKIHNGRINEDITLVVDQRNKETHQHMPFDGYVMTRVISDCNHEHALVIRHEESHQWLGLQAVDFISWGLFRHHEHNDNRYRTIILPKIGVCDSWCA